MEGTSRLPSRELTRIATNRQQPKIQTQPSKYFIPVQIPTAKRNLEEAFGDTDDNEGVEDKEGRKDVTVMINSMPAMKMEELYHYTSYENLLCIQEDGIIEATLGFHNRTGVWLTKLEPLHGIANGVSSENPNVSIGLPTAKESILYNNYNYQGKLSSNRF